MKLLSITEFINTQFCDESRPTERAVKRWIDNGDFPFEIMKMGGKFFIDTDSLKKGSKKINPLVERILSHGQTT